MPRFPSSLASLFASALSAMPAIAALAVMTVTAALFQGCMTDNNRSGNGPVRVSDSSDFDEYGARRPTTPKVEYRTHDSLVTLHILGPEYGEQNSYWIIRNGQLRESPNFLYGDSGVYQYYLVDTIRSAGTYVYFVQYGRQKTRLSRKSPEFTYVFPGHSRSGVVSLSGENQSVVVALDNAPGQVTGRVRFERKIGSEGDIAILDTVEKSGDQRLVWLDPGMIALDTVLYYRATALDAVSEKWLEPTSWDSIAVRNLIWTYIPMPTYRNLGDEILFGIRNTILMESPKAMYRLHRSETPERDDGEQVDSLPMSGPAYNLGSFRDAPPDSGTWYYWFDARDPNGRISPRSVPMAITVTGRPAGAVIADFSVSATAIRIHLLNDPEATGYLLQRAWDTAVAIVDVDSILRTAPNDLTTFTDIPPTEGHWYYRIVTLFPGSRSDPGEWELASYFRRESIFERLDISLSNRGAAGVEAELPAYMNARYYLYRSARADGSDSVAVDSAAGSPAAPTLRDKPPVGTWYYRVFRFDKPSGTSFAIYRSNLVRVDFTGKAVGPAVKRLRLYGTGIDVDLGIDAEAVAYVVERSFEASGTWTVFDTVSAGAMTEQTVSDHPPKAGYWSYRARSLTRDLSLTEPGLAVRSETDWSYSVKYDNQLQAIIANTGERVECALTTSNDYGYYLFRSRTADYADAFAADTAQIDDPDSRLLDVPDRGIWYYWVERMIGARENLNAIYRSVPARVEFTGSPEIISLVLQGNGVRIAYPQAPSGDTLEILRSEGEDGDSASFVRISRDWGTYTTGTNDYLDQSLEGKPSAFYRYRLAVVHGSERRAAGPAKILYYRRTDGVGLAP